MSNCRGTALYERGLIRRDSSINSKRMLAILKRYTTQTTNPSEYDIIIWTPDPRAEFGVPVVHAGIIMDLERMLIKSRLGEGGIVKILPVGEVLSNIKWEYNGMTQEGWNYPTLKEFYTLK
jgi:hypothetical protein